MLSSSSTPNSCSNFAFINSINKNSRVISSLYLPKISVKNVKRRFHQKQMLTILIFQDSQRVVEKFRFVVVEFVSVAKVDSYDNCS